MNVDELAAIPLFSARNVDAGVKLIGEGATGASLYVLVAGRVTVTIGGDEIRTLGPGDVFGELALLAVGRRTATVTTTEPSRVLVLFGDDVERLRSDYPEVAAGLEAAMRSRLG